MREHGRLRLPLALLCGAALALGGCVGWPQGARPAETARDVAAPATVAVPARLTLAHGGSGTVQAQLNAVDPATLGDLPGYAPLPFGHHWQTALSPDGRTLAAVIYPRGTDNLDGVLHLIDLEHWTDRATAVSFGGWVYAIAFAPDGKSLYWLFPGLAEANHGLPRDFALYRYDLAGGSGGSGSAGSNGGTGGAPQVVTRLAHRFAPGPLRFLRSGRRLVIYGIGNTDENLADGPPRVLGIDLPKGRLAYDLPLEGVRAGQRRVKAGDGKTTGDQAGDANITGYEADEPALAWDAPRDRLYVVHGDAQVTVVDLAAGKVLRQATVAPRRSWLERLGLERRGEAKMVPGIFRQAAISPDGSRLYVTARRDSLSRENGVTHWREQGTGVQVIDTADLSEVRRLDLPVSRLQLSPDGRWLLLTGAERDVPDGGRDVPKGSGVYLLDTQHSGEPLHLLAGQECFVPAFAPDGRYAYVAVMGSREQVQRILDLAAQRFSGERALPGWADYPGAH